MNAGRVSYGMIGGTLVFKPLPIEAQYAPVYAIEAADVDKDGRKYLISVTVPGCVWERGMTTKDRSF